MPEVQIDPTKPERRQVDFDQVEMREEDDKIKFRGHAAVFDKWSEDLGGFKERIQRGAFRKVLNEGADVRFLFNHNSDFILARTKSGTMELREDPKGLLVEADLAPTSFAKDLRILVNRGDIDGMSFAFLVGRDEWDETDENQAKRTVTEYKDLFDVGPVTYPAYPQTTVGMRSLNVCGIDIDLEDFDPEKVRDLAHKIHRGELQATMDERSAIDAVLLEHTTTASPWMKERAVRAISQEPDEQGFIQGKRVSVVLEDAPSGDAVPYRLAARTRRLHALAGA